ncbi:ceramide glucosyltransferase [Defluviimonas sp. 20V17]|uniref:Ceramide glucosyltransferase n=1 Tax=Allgaiera indica TaxID=765699 RepID=A0AAN4ZZQ0_9RHOB|nr:ceramide glucosyltransferase [Allgaiera indica]KDB01833.1 ceramide glucosyltransferase [Defluviimonas sp. 20V17]GHE02434.1 ceramide glucosyltransferase [Allgaiera indica]SDX29992.1 ceramide glucosyltransferase [Allgaiera indica]
MGAATAILTLFVLGALGLHLLSVTIVSLRLARARRSTARAGQPPVSLLRPLCGLEYALEETLATSFAQEYAEYEVIFCVERVDDPAIPLAEKLIAAHPDVPAKLLIGTDPISGNPKLNNLVKGWNAARHDWIVMSDSNVLLPPDFLRVSVSRFDARTGLVSSPPVGIRPENAWGALECGFLNTYQARWQLLADSLGLGYAQGKTLFWRRGVVEAGGGLARLGGEMAEDVASTKLVRGLGLNVRLAPEPFAQPIGRRGFGTVWSRQLRWARVRRLGFPLLFTAEILTGALPPVLAIAALAAAGAASWICLPGLVMLWFAAEWGLARQAGWPQGARDVAMWMLRDLMLPAIWVAAWAGRGFTWRGNQMDKAGADGLSTAK